MQEELQQHVLRSMVLVSVQGRLDSDINYTSGSVTSKRDSTGAAVVVAGQVLSWRTPNYCSTLQTELVTIKQALEHARHCQERVVVIHTDCCSALQVLQWPCSPPDKVRLTTTYRDSSHRGAMSP